MEEDPERGVIPKKGAECENFSYYLAGAPREARRPILSEGDKIGESRVAS